MPTITSPVWPTGQDLLSAKRYSTYAVFDYAGGGLPAMLGQERLISMRSFGFADFSSQSLRCTKRIE